MFLLLHGYDNNIAIHSFVRSLVICYAVKFTKNIAFFSHKSYAMRYKLTMKTVNGNSLKLTTATDPPKN